MAQLMLAKTETAMATIMVPIVKVLQVLMAHKVQQDQLVRRVPQVLKAQQVQLVQQVLRVQPVR